MRVGLVCGRVSISHMTGFSEAKRRQVVLIIVMGSLLAILLIYSQSLLVIFMRDS